MPSARVAELVDAPDLKSVSSNRVPVRFRPRAPNHCAADIMNFSVPSVMRAWVVTRYGDPSCLALRQVPIPSLGSHDVLIRVIAATVSSGDRRLRAMDFPRGMKTLGRLAFGITRPRQRILGSECAGTIAAIGSQVNNFSVGDEVIAFPDMKAGAHAEYCRMAEDGLIIKRPPAIPVEQASALCFSGLTALDFIRRAGIGAQTRVLVLGASGAVGSAFVQLARLKGAMVTATTSTANMPLVHQLGAHAVIDYTQHEITALEDKFDVVADTVGHLHFPQAVPLLADHGRYIAINGDLQDMLARSRGTRRCIAGPAKARREDLAEIVALTERQAFVPLIDSVYAFADLPQAHARVDTGRKKGSVVVMDH